MGHRRGGMPRSGGRLRHFRAGRAGDPDYEIPVRPKTSKPDARFSHWRRVDCQGDDAPPLGLERFLSLTHRRGVSTRRGRVTRSTPRHFAPSPPATRKPSGQIPTGYWSWSQSAPIFTGWSIGMPSGRSGPTLGSSIGAISRTRGPETPPTPSTPC